MKASDILPPSSSERDSGKLLALTRKKTQLETKLSNLIVAVENGSLALAKRLLEVEGELKAVQKEISEAEPRSRSRTRRLLRS